MRRGLAACLTLLLASQSAGAGEGSAEHRRRAGLGTLVTGLTLLGATAAVMLSAIRPDGEPSPLSGGAYERGYANYGFSAGLPLLTFGLVLTGVGAPLYAIGRIDQNGPPGEAALKLRSRLGKAFIALGVLMQAASMIIGPMEFRRQLEYNPCEFGFIRPNVDCTGPYALGGSTITLGLVGVSVMASGIPLLATAKRDLQLRVGVGSLALAF